jgi:hypothetical protein
VEEVVREFLRTRYLTRQRRTVASVYREIIRECRTRGLARRLDSVSGGPIAYVATPAGQVAGQQATLAAPAVCEEGGR